MQAGGRDETFMLICLFFMCVVRLVLSLTLCLRLCFRSLPGAKTEEPLCLPTDISKLILFCLCRGYNSNNRGMGGGGWVGKLGSGYVAVCLKIMCVKIFLNCAEDC